MRCRPRTTPLPPLERIAPRGRPAARVLSLLLTRGRSSTFLLPHECSPSSAARASPSDPPSSSLPSVTPRLAPPAHWRAPLGPLGASAPARASAAAPLAGPAHAPCLPPQRPWARSPDRLSSLRSSALATPSALPTPPERTPPSNPRPSADRAAASPDYSPLSSPGSTPPHRPAAIASCAVLRSTFFQYLDGMALKVE
ncbi:hypothetical protein AB1Y20_013551 [Prymnesium parvum]|uniref:Uncharacterized protein n=1 Tax=Prymnesium parvum TaxID=97485 RepID=A0AB34IG61_PRYPA